MIAVPRDQVDEAGVPIRPAAGWFARAAEATETAKAEGPHHEVDRGLYAHGQVQMALERLFSDKCAYCECKAPASASWDVEHFRPKGRVAEREEHPGYYWLAYTWSNLYLSCQFCNQLRTDKPRWGDPAAGAAAGKLDQFPLADEATRAMTPADDLAGEARLLLDPCSDPVEEVLGYTVGGDIVARDGDPRGETSIRVFHLRRRRLRDLRRQKVIEVRDLLRLIGGLAEPASSDFQAFLARHYLDGAREHAGASRAVVKDPVAFGMA